MSYLRAQLVDQEDDLDHCFTVRAINFEDRPTIDRDLHDEQLDFVLSLIENIDDLREGEALVVWKEIF